MAVLFRDTGSCNLVLRVSHLTDPWGGKMRDPGNEVEDLEFALV